MSAKKAERGSAKEVREGGGGGSRERGRLGRDFKSVERGEKI